MNTEARDVLALPHLRFKDINNNNHPDAFPGKRGRDAKREKNKRVQHDTTALAPCVFKYGGVTGAVRPVEPLQRQREWKPRSTAFNLLLTTLAIALLTAGRRTEMSHAIKRESASEVPK